MKLQRHDNVGALALLDRAHAIDANNPEIGYHYAVALDATGKREAAKTLLKAVLERSPGFEGAADARQLVARW